MCWCSSIFLSENKTQKVEKSAVVGQKCSHYERKFVSEPKDKIIHHVAGGKNTVIFVAAAVILKQHQNCAPVQICAYAFKSAVSLCVTLHCVTALCKHERYPYTQWELLIHTHTPCGLQSYTLPQSHLGKTCFLLPIWMGGQKMEEKKRG